MTQMFNDCSICNELNGIENTKQDKEYRRLIKTKSNILYKSTNFSVIPSIGAINRFHLLIVTNNCINSFANLNKECFDEYKLIKNYIRNYNLEYFDMDTILFEHGSGSCVNCGGSCISHAHMHIIAIPKKIDFTNMVSILNLNPIKYPIDINQLVQSGYLYFQDAQNNSVLNYSDIYPSQILRKYIINLLGEPEKWDWRIFKRYDNVQIVIKNYLNLQNYIVL